MASQVNGYIGQINPGDGTNYAIGSTAYGVCATAAGTAAKVVDMTGFSLKTGATIFVKFTYANTSSTAPTLNVNSTGAKPLISTADKVAKWKSGEVIALTYDGTSWCAQEIPQNSSLAISTDQTGTSVTFTDNTGTESNFDIPSNNGTHKFYMNVTSVTSPYLYIYLDEDFTSTTKMVYGKIFLYPYNVIGNFDELQFNFYYRDAADALENCYFFDHFDKVPSMSALLDTTTHKVVLKVPNIARYTTYTAEVYVGATPYKNIVSNMDRFTPSGENWTETAFTRRSLDDVIGGSFQPKITAEGVLSGDGDGNITGNVSATTSSLDTFTPNMLGIDTAPASGSSNLITSGGVYAALGNGSGKVVIVTNSTTYAEVTAILAAGNLPVYKYTDGSKDCYLPFEHKESTTQYYFSSGYYNGWQTAVAYAILTTGNTWSLSTKVLALVDTSTNKIQADLITANVTAISSNTTLGASHANCLLKCTGAITITIPSSLSANEIEIMNYGTNTVTVTAAAAVTLNGVAGGSKTIPNQYTSAVLKCVGSNEWVIQGAIS